jgi:hypothetical protein
MGDIDLDYYREIVADARDEGHWVGVSDDEVADLVAEIVRLRAALERAQPVLDAAHAWLRAPGTEAHNLAAAVTAHKSTPDGSAVDRG